MRHSIGAAILLALLAGAVFAQCPGGVCYAPTWPTPVQVPQASAQAQPWPSIARVVGSDGTAGSGTLVYESPTEAWVLTCAHLADSGSQEYAVRFPGGLERTAKAIGIDHGHNDLLILRMQPTGIVPAPVRTTHPAPDETLWIAGYGGGSFAWQHGRANYDYHNTLCVQGAKARFGDSGGPIIDIQGRLVSVISGSGGGIGQATVGCTARPIQRILGNVLGGIASTPKRDNLALAIQITLSIDGGEERGPHHGLAWMPAARD